ncbi:NUDIX hydrolase [Abyssisolibacter fermentans]|uniref:NUDIX hydrolase n=1 Tax=Abyssisolibacter fermentans TaxID=1766203 RepID=UPI0008340C5E|nr:NUDIX domain-containing protein [Abyssisolibacter fermentans]
MSLENKFFVALKALIFFEERFLIIKRTDKARGDFYHWEFPGGRLEFGESPKEALKREIIEETGLKNVDCLYPINAWNFLKDEHTEIIGITYLCKSEDKKIELSIEHDEYAWISYDDIINYNFSPGILEDIKKWNWQQILKDIVK